MNVTSVSDTPRWFRREQGRDFLKILAGIRGAGKTHALRGLIDDLRGQGVDEANIVLLDFESPQMRHVKTHADVMEIIKKRKASGKVYVFLDEITGLLDFEILMGVLFGHKELDITIATSNRRLLTDTVKTYFKGRMSALRVGAPRERTRDAAEIQRVWSTLFLRDVLGGHYLADATAQERLAEFFSDRLGEQLSLRRVAGSLVIDGRKLHPNTIGTYTEALLGSYLIEAAPIYDVFERYVMNTGNRYFWTDPELRMNRFGPSPDFESERAAYNEAYLRLRRKHGTVMCIRSNDTFADFVVFQANGEPEVKKWKES